MPFANEHAARLLDPKRFDRFRRKAGGKIFGGKLEVPKTISIIWGHIKDGPPEAWAAQALRFPTKNWTADAAKKWLKDKKLKTIMFEAAVKPKKKKTLAVHKSLHSLWEMEDPTLKVLGINRDVIQYVHAEIVKAMEEQDLAHASLLIGHTIAKAEEFDLDNMVEHTLNDIMGELEPIVIEEPIFEIAKNCPIFKVDEEERMVYGIVLEPNVVDAQGDIISIEEIRKTAHKFMEFEQKIGVQHTDFKKKFRIMESFLAPVEFMVGGKTIRMGTWILAVRVVSDKTWEKVKKGEITGFSVGGTGTRTQVA